MTRGEAELDYDLVERLSPRDEAVLSEACLQIFPNFQLAYLTHRLGKITDPALVRAWKDRQLVGFKLGYRRGERVFYSWLGGVHPELRGRGVARRLMMMQHEWAREADYEVIETRTRAENSPMIVLNLTSGFVVTGFEVDAQGMGVVTQRKQVQAKP